MVSVVVRAVSGLSGGRAVAPVLALLLGLTLSRTGSAQVSAQPVILPLTTSDSAVVGIVVVRNEGQTEEQFRFYPYDFDQDEAGVHTFSPVGRIPRSCTSRMSVFPSSATLLPGERQQVRVRLGPGAESCWAVVLVERVQHAAQGIMPTEQIAVKVYGVPPTATKAAEMDTVTAEPAKDGARVTFLVRNTGEAPVRPEGTVELRSLAGAVLATTRVEAFSVLPEHRRRMTIVVPAHLDAGPYVAVPILDFGMDYLIGGQAEFRVP